jgi:hypothetical protein
VEVGLPGRAGRPTCALDRRTRRGLKRALDGVSS